MDKKTQTLYDIFMSQTVIELQLHRKFYDVWRVKSNARKAQLAEALAELFIEEPWNCLKRMPLYELRFLELLARQGEGEKLTLNRTTIPLASLTTGLTQINLSNDNPFTFDIWFVPGVRTILAPHISRAIRDIENSPRHEFEQFLWGTLALFGAITYSEFFELLGHHYKNDTEETWFFHFLHEDFPMLSRLEYRNYLVHPCADIRELLKEREEKKFTKRVPKKFTKEDILDAGSVMPYSSVWHLHEEGRNLADALQSIGYEDDRMVYVMHEIWFDKQRHGQNAKAFNGLITRILEGGKVGRFEDVQKVADAIMRYSNAIPCWCFKGRSSDEMFKQDKQGPEKLANAQAVVHQMANISRQASAFPKVGRNDPCPCGSGLKYKNCHGKNQS